jgi:DNA invertase Pin-like site-specific DNA recombinase
LRVVGYLRESVDPQDGEASFAQSERIRRWANESGHQLVAVCQDVRTPGRELGRNGLRALVGIVAAGEVDAVIVSSLNTFSPDKITQEVMIGDLRHRGVAVLTADEEEQPLLEDPCPDQVRLLVRDVLAKVERHRELVGKIGNDDADATIVQVDESSDVIVELIPADRRLGPAEVRPAR